MLDDHSTEIEAKASPTKIFFISMLTRDIALSDCILDLLDNAVDGIRETFVRKEKRPFEDRGYDGYPVEITFDGTQFRITDRSGGIPLKIAREYAFRFGRPNDAPDPAEGAIGIYGIGMKRAMFKMGRKIELVSSTGEESFRLDLDVVAWAKDDLKTDLEAEDEEAGDAADGGDTATQSATEQDNDVDWTFPLRDVRRGGTTVAVGTTIIISELYETIARDLKNPEFETALIRTMSRDYAFILASGLEATVNGKPVHGKMPSLRESADLKPFRFATVLDGVQIEIQAGLADPPPDDTSAKARQSSDLYGWYLVCNDRVIVTADKTYLSGWGRKPVPAWHPQYNGFLGVVRFESDKPQLLPWKTTKRDVETSNAAYQAALPSMMAAARQFTEYSERRKLDRRKAKKLEKQAPTVSVGVRVTQASSFTAPQIDGPGEVAIEFTKAKSQVDALAEALGLIGNSPSEVGQRAFDYCYKREVPNG